MDKRRAPPPPPRQEPQEPVFEVAPLRRRALADGAAAAGALHLPGHGHRAGASDGLGRFPAKAKRHPGPPGRGGGAAHGQAAPRGSEGWAALTGAAEPQPLAARSAAPLPEARPGTAGRAEAPPARRRPGRHRPGRRTLTAASRGPPGRPRPIPPAPAGSAGQPDRRAQAASHRAARQGRDAERGARPLASRSAPRSHPRATGLQRPPPRGTEGPRSAPPRCLALPPRRSADRERGLVPGPGGEGGPEARRHGNGQPPRGKRRGGGSRVRSWERGSPGRAPGCPEGADRPGGAEGSEAVDLRDGAWSAPEQDAEVPGGRRARRGPAAELPGGGAELAGAVRNSVRRLSWK